jgi:hypothetical protein
MSDTITFAPNTGTIPTFVGRGSKIEHPDILPIFRGSCWPIGCPVTSNDIMKALYLLAGGPYLQGLSQYGYVGPAQVRNAIIDNTPLAIPLPPPAPGISQTTVITNAVASYIESLVDNDGIDNVDDNHDLIVMVFLDPSIPKAVDTDSAGNQTTVSGANKKMEIFEFLDDNIRFQWAWIATSANNLADITETLSHELVEAISDPFNSGWVQTSPTPPAGLEAQIADVCNPPAFVNGVWVSSYWSNADNACIVPTSGTRKLSLSQILDKHEPHDGKTQQGYVDFPIICGGGRYFDYVERTYRNVLTVHAKFDGYESPVVGYTINGQAVSFMIGTVEVDADWDVPRSNPIFPDLYLKPPKARLRTWLPSTMSTELTIDVGPNAGNTSLRVVVTVSESFDDPNAGGGSTKRTAFLDVDLMNQEIIWGSGHDSAVKNCERMEHLADGPNVVFGPPRPEDPFEMVDMVVRAVRDHSSSRAENLMNAAQLVNSSRPEVAQALISLAQRVS